MATYRVFKRTWWKENPSYPDGLEPSPGKKRYTAKFPTEEAARKYCQRRNREPRTPREERLALKYEYTGVGQ